VGPASLSLVVFGLGIPVLFLVVLVRHRASITQDQMLYATDQGGTAATNPQWRIRRRYKELYQPFRPKMFFFVLVVQLRKVGGLCEPGRGLLSGPGKALRSTSGSVSACLACYYT
jgi:hypothetical protein